MSGGFATLTAYTSGSGDMSVTGMILWMAGAGAFFFLLLWLVRKSGSRIGSVEYLLPDAGGAYLHVFGVRLLPNNGKHLYRHFVFDLGTFRFTEGGSRMGMALDLNSKFVRESVQELEQRLQVRLRIEVPVDEDEDDDDDSWEDDDDPWDDDDGEPIKPLADQVRDGEVEVEIVVDFTEFVPDTSARELSVYTASRSDSDTAVRTIPYDDYIVLVEHSEREISSLQLFRDGRLAAEHGLKIRYGHIRHQVAIPSRDWLCFTYDKATAAGDRQHLCILRFADGALVFDGKIAAGR